jgi:hypothetical protein
MKEELSKVSTENINNLIMLAPLLRGWRGGI